MSRFCFGECLSESLVFLRFIVYLESGDNGSFVYRWVLCGLDGEISRLV